MSNVSDWNAIGTAQRGRIVTCDPPTRKIEAQLKDQSIVQVAIWETGAVFRWPVVDEVWTLNRVGGVWRLGDPVDLNTDNPIEGMDSGDVRISAPGRVLSATPLLDPTNVKYYGAKGDGTTDDTLAIQTALDAIPSGGVLFFPDGNYIFVAVTCTTNDITLYGRATLTSIYENDNVTNAMWLSGDKVTVNGLTFVNANSQTPAAHAAGGMVENGVLLIVGRTAFGVPPAQIATVQNCTFYGSYSSQFEVRNARNVFVMNNRLFNSSGNGMSMTNCTDNVLIDGNQVYNTGDDMIVVVTDTSTPLSTLRVTIVNNIVDTGDAKGIATTGADRLIIANNHIRNTFTFGIGVMQDGFFGLGASNRAIVANNTLERCGSKYGFGHLHTAVGTVPFGIYVGAGSQSVSITNNTIIDTEGAAIIADTQHQSTTSSGSHTFPVGTITVTSTANLTSFGVATIITTNGTASTFSYTGKTATTLTGVAGGFGTFAGGSIVIQATVGLTIEGNQIIGAGGAAMQIGDPDGSDWIRVLDLSIANNRTRNTKGGIIVGSVTGGTILGNHVRSYKQGFVGARRGILLGSNRNLVYDHNIVFNDDGGDETILVYGVNKHVVDGGSNITLAPSDP